MRSAAVGHQCVDCVQEGARSIPQVRTAAGGVVRSGKPVVTYGLIAANVVMFVLQLASTKLQSDLVLWPPAVAGGQWYRMVTAAFMHYGIAHLLFNMWALYVIGPPLESYLGRLRFSGLYALSALGGSVLVYLLSAVNAATAGASGAIFGLFGAIFVLAKQLNFNLRWVAGLIVLNLVLTFAGPAVIGQAISWQGHIGGLITGVFVTAAYVYAPRAHRNQIQAAVTIGTLVVFALLTYWRTVDLLNAYGAFIGHR